MKVKVKVTQKDGEIGLSLRSGEYKTFTVTSGVIEADEADAALLVSHGGATYVSEPKDEPKP